ncbi:MAG: DUF2817 domain-containing protein [Planctomycetota bacterium]
MRALLLLLPLVVVWGCRSAEVASSPPDDREPEQGEQESRAATALAAAAWQPTTFEVGRSVNGSPIEAVLLGGDRQKPVVLMLAGLHGDEQSGTPLLRRLERHLTEHPGLLEERAVLLIPIANPDGFEQGSRHNARGIDLNRNFPASNFEPSRRRGQTPLSEPESQALFSLLHSILPVRVVSIHMAASLVDFDGPAAALAQAMSAHCRLPARRLGNRLGSLGSYVGADLATPIITLELTAGDRALAEEELWERYGEALLEAIRWPL